MKVTCECGSVMVVDDRRFGSMVRCPQCGEDVLVSSANGPPPPPLPDHRSTPLEPPRKRWTEPPNLPPAPTSEPASVPVTVAPPAPATLSQTLETNHEQSEIEPPPLPSALPGVEPSEEWRRSALHLAIALGLIGVFSAVPAIVHLFHNSPLASVLAMAMPRWAAFLLLLSGIHIAYAFYVAQLPDWSTVWVVAITMLALATLNSVMLAVTLLGSPNASLVRLLELHDYLRGGRAAGWCFIMLCLSVTVAYCAGRMAARWHAAETARLQALHIID